MAAPHTAFGNDVALAPGDFERVRRLIKDRAGIHLQPSKQSMVQGRLARLLREHGLPDYRALLDAVDRPNAALWQPFVNALTTNLTSFFRESYHFPLLAEYLQTLRGPVRIWCAAASTGEEPWSLAMTALETLGPAAQVSIYASTSIPTCCAPHGPASIRWTATRGSIRPGSSAGS
jgi:chemotaxis protein methyltransferase CheR